MATTPASSPSVANSVSGGAGAPVGPNWFPGWETSVLGLIGAPITNANVAWLDAWHLQDLSGTNPPALNNPLNVTAYPPIPVTVGQGKINTSGVQSYSTPAQGAQATAAFLKMPNFSAILSALKSGNAGKYEFDNTVSGDKSVSHALSTWSGGGYSSVAKGDALGGFPGGNAIVSSGPVKAIEGAVNATSTAATSTADFLGKLSDPSVWIRIGEVVAGILLVGMGLYLIAKDFGVSMAIPEPVKKLADKAGGAMSPPAGGSGPIEAQPRRVQRQAGFEPQSPERDLREARARRAANRVPLTEEIPY